MILRLSVAGAAAAVTAAASLGGVCSAFLQPRPSPPSALGRAAFCPSSDVRLRLLSSLSSSSFDYDLESGESSSSADADLEYGYEYRKANEKPVFNRRLKRRTNRSTVAFSKHLSELSRIPRRCSPRAARAAAKAADDALRATMEDIRCGAETEISLNVIVFTIVLRGWERAASKGVKGASDAALELLRVMENLGDAGDDLARPDALAYSSVLNALAKSAAKDRGAAARAEELLEDMIDRYLDGNDGDGDGYAAAKPNGVSYNTVIAAWANAAAHSKEAPERAEDLLRRMKRQWEERRDRDDDGDGDELRPDVLTYSGVINAYGRSTRDDGPARAEALLDEMERSDDELLEPDAVAYNSVINAYARLAARLGKRRRRRYGGGGGNDNNSGGDDDARRAADRAYSIFRRMDENESKDDDSSSINARRADAYSYNTVLNALANAGGPQCADRALDLLDEMKRRSYSDPTLRPDAFTYTSAIKAVASSGEPDAADDAVELLRDMTAPPSAAAYNAAIDALARSGQGVEGALKAEGLLDEMDGTSPRGDDAEFGSSDGNEDATPNVITYTSAIKAWAAASAASSASAESEGGSPSDASDAPAERAERLLRRMISRHRRTGDADLQPDAAAYAGAIKAWADSDARDKGPRAEGLLRSMMMDGTPADDDDDDDDAGGGGGAGGGLPPNAYPYTLAIKAYATGHSRDPERSESLLREMRQFGLAVSPAVYRSAIGAWTYVGGSECSNRAEKLLKEMMEERRNDGPDPAAFGMTIRALAESGGVGDVERAEALLSEWEEAGEGDDEKDETGNGKPDEESYRAVVDALEKAGEEDRARQVFWRMQEL